MRKFAFAAGAVLIATGIAAATGMFKSTNSKLLAACMEVISDREDYPETVKVFKSAEPTIKTASLDDYMGWTTTGKKDRDTTRAETEPAYNNLLKINKEMFEYRTYSIADIPLVYLANDASGGARKKAGPCTITWPSDEEPFTDNQSTTVRINGLTDNEWHMERIEDLQNAIKG